MTARGKPRRVLPRTWATLGAHARGISEPDYWRELRIASRYSLATAAAAIGTTKSTVHNWESGISTPPPDLYRVMISLYKPFRS